MSPLLHFSRWYQMHKSSVCPCSMLMCAELLTVSARCKESTWEQGPQAQCICNVLGLLTLLYSCCHSSVYVVAGKAGIACLHGARAVSECASEHRQRPVGARLRHVRVRGRGAALCSRIPHPPGAGHHDSRPSPNTRCINDNLL